MLTPGTRLGGLKEKQFTLSDDDDDADGHDDDDDDDVQEVQDVEILPSFNLSEAVHSTPLDHAAAPSSSSSSSSFTRKELPQIPSTSKSPTSNDLALRESEKKIAQLENQMKMIDRNQVSFWIFF